MYLEDTFRVSITKNICFDIKYIPKPNSSVMTFIHLKKTEIDCN